MITDAITDYCLTQVTPLFQTDKIPGPNGVCFKEFDHTLQSLKGFPSYLITDETHLHTFQVSVPCYVTTL